MRYDFIVDDDQETNTEKEPLWIFVILDESDRSVIEKQWWWVFDPWYQKKREEYPSSQLWIVWSNLNIDHRLVTKTSLLSWSDILQIIIRFFQAISKFKKYDNLVINHCSQFHEIQRFIKKWFNVVDTQSLRRQEVISAIENGSWRYRLYWLEDNWYGYTSKDTIFLETTWEKVSFQLYNKL